jgi:hypothetical protein
LQSGVRVGGHHHAVGLFCRSKVIDETPRTNHLEFGVRQSASDRDTSSRGELYCARLDQNLGTPSIARVIQIVGTWSP